jgi:hypothetical protein
MESGNQLWPRRRCRNARDRKTGSIRGEHSGLGTELIELPEHLSFQGHVFKNSFNKELCSLAGRCEVIAFVYETDFTPGARKFTGNPDAHRSGADNGHAR